MTFTAPELAVYGSVLFFILLALALFSYECGMRQGRICGIREMIADQIRANAQNEAQKRAWFQK